jgi:Zn-dependent protease
MFGKSVRLFNLLGFEVKIDFSWIFIAVLVAWSLSTGVFPLHYKNLSAQTYWLMGILGVLGLFLSIILHELAHSLVARRSGMAMKGITLFIFGGIAEMGEEPPGPKAEFMMAIAGPIASVLLTLIFYGLSVLAQRGGAGSPITGILSYLAFINGILALFNLVPAFPLDGGRILRSILWGIKKNLNWATRVSSRIGSGFGIFLIVMGVINVLWGNFLGGMWWALIGLFLHGAAKASYQRLVIRRTLEGEPLSRFMKKDPVTVEPDIPLETLVEDYIYKFHFKMFPVMQDGAKLRGCVGPKDLKQVPREDWTKKTVNDIAQTCNDENTIAADKDAVEALSQMNRTGASRLLVTEGDRLVGIIALKDMLRFLSMKMELED